MGRTHLVGPCVGLTQSQPLAHGSHHHSPLHLNHWDSAPHQGLAPQAALKQRGRGKGPPHCLFLLPPPKPWATLWEAVLSVPSARLSWPEPHSARFIVIHILPEILATRKEDFQETSCFPLGFTSPNHQHVGGPRLLLLSAHRGSQEL